MAFAKILQRCTSGASMLISGCTQSSYGKFGKNTVRQTEEGNAFNLEVIC